MAVLAAVALAARVFEILARAKRRAARMPWSQRFAIVRELAALLTDDLADTG